MLRSIIKPYFPANIDNPPDGYWKYLASVGFSMEELKSCRIKEGIVLRLSSFQAMDLLCDGTRYNDVPIWIHTDQGARHALYHDIEDVNIDYFKNAALMFPLPGCIPSEFSAEITAGNYRSVGAETEISTSIIDVKTSEKTFSADVIETLINARGLVKEEELVIVEEENGDLSYFIEGQQLLSQEYIIENDRIYLIIPEISYSGVNAPSECVVLFQNGWIQFCRNLIAISKTKDGIIEWVKFPSSVTESPKVQVIINTNADGISTAVGVVGIISNITPPGFTAQTAYPTYGMYIKADARISWNTGQDVFDHMIRSYLYDVLNNEFATVKVYGEETEEYLIDGVLNMDVYIPYTVGFGQRASTYLEDYYAESSVIDDLTRFEYDELRHNALTSFVDSGLISYGGFTETSSRGYGDPVPSQIGGEPRSWCYKEEDDGDETQEGLMARSSANYEIPAGEWVGPDDFGSNVTYPVHSSDFKWVCYNGEMIQVTSGDRKNFIASGSASHTVNWSFPTMLNVYWAHDQYNTGIGVNIYGGSGPILPLSLDPSHTTQADTYIQKFNNGWQLDSHASGSLSYIENTSWTNTDRCFLEESGSYDSSASKFVILNYTITNGYESQEFIKVLETSFSNSSSSFRDEDCYLISEINPIINTFESVRIVPINVAGENLFYNMKLLGAWLIHQGSSWTHTYDYDSETYSGSVSYEAFTKEDMFLEQVESTSILTSSTAIQDILTKIESDMREDYVKMDQYVITHNTTFYQATSFNIEIDLSIHFVPYDVRG